MHETQLPTRAEMFERVVEELHRARNALSEASSWARSDWRPLGSSLTDAGGEARSEVFDEVGEMKGRIDKLKERVHKAIDAEDAKEGRARARG